MKREILCEECGDKARTRIRCFVPASVEGPPERVDFLSGKLVAEATCDQCGDFINEGALATALSIRVIPRQASEMLGWERQYFGGDE